MPIPVDGATRLVIIGDGWAYDFAVTAAGLVGVRITRVDVEVTLPLRQRVLRPHQAAGDLVFPGDRAADTAHVAAVLPGGRVVGIASVMREEAPWGEPGWRLRAMATEEDARGSGIGARLLAIAVGHMRAHGGGLLWCNARLGAVRFYERAGLRRWGEPWEEPHIGPHVVLWRMI